MYAIFLVELNENMKSLTTGVMSVISPRTLCYVLWQEGCVGGCAAVILEELCCACLRQSQRGKKGLLQLSRKNSKALTELPSQKTLSARRPLPSFKRGCKVSQTVSMVTQWCLPPMLHIVSFFHRLEIFNNWLNWTAPCCRQHIFITSLRFV